MNDIKIKKIQKSGSIVRLYITELEKPIILPEISAIQHNLTEGAIISPDQLELLVEESLLFTCHKEAQRLLALRNHSVGELRFKLTNKKFPIHLQKKVISDLIEQGLLDDTAYALHLAERLIIQKPCGRSYIMAYLQRKRIDRKLAEETSNEVLSKLDMNKQALDSLRKKWHMFDHLELEDARKKSYNYLSRRGFSYDVSKNAFETVTKDNNEELEN
jgi:SOS response regulatory protein OraA/RecX